MNKYEITIIDIILISGDDPTSTKLLSSFIEKMESIYGMRWMKKISMSEKKLYNELTDITLKNTKEKQVKEYCRKLESKHGVFWFNRVTKEEKEKLDAYEKDFNHKTFLEQYFETEEDSDFGSPKTCWSPKYEDEDSIDWLNVSGSMNSLYRNKGDDDLQKAIAMSLVPKNNARTSLYPMQDVEPFTDVPDFDMSVNPTTFKKADKLSQRQNNI